MELKINSHFLLLSSCLAASQLFSHRRGENKREKRRKITFHLRNFVVQLPADGQHRPNREWDQQHGPSHSPLHIQIGNIRNIKYLLLMKDFWGMVGWMLHPSLSQGESCGADVEEGDTTKWSMMVTPRDTRVPQSLSGHAGASAEPP